MLLCRCMDEQPTLAAAVAAVSSSNSTYAIRTRSNASLPIPGNKCNQYGIIMQQMQSQSSCTAAAGSAASSIATVPHARLTAALHSYLRFLVR